MDYAIWKSRIIWIIRKITRERLNFALVYNLPTAEMSKGVFIQVRFATICCADDVTFLGVKQKYAKSEEIPHKSFVKVRGR